jgi:hypothetical protein
MRAPWGDQVGEVSRAGWRVRLVDSPEAISLLYTSEFPSRFDTKARKFP